MEVTRPIVIADPSRARRVRLEHALEDRGHDTVATGSGRVALRLIAEHTSTFLVSHVGVRCGNEPIGRVIRRDYRSLSPRQVVWFGAGRAASGTIASSGHFVCCAYGLQAVTDTIDDLVDRESAEHRHTDVLLSLLRLDAALAELSGWSL